VRAFRYAPAAPGGVEDFGVSFFAYAAGFRGGVTVAVGNLDGNGPEIITGAGPGGGPHVRAFHYAPAAVGGVTDDAAVNFFAYTPLFTGGVHVAAGNLTGGSRAELITGAGPGGGPHVRVFFDGTVADVPGFFAYVPGFTGGVSVGVAGSEVLTGVGPGGGPHVRRFASDGSPLGGGFFAFPFP